MGWIAGSLDWNAGLNPVRITRLGDGQRTQTARFYERDGYIVSWSGRLDSAGDGAVGPGGKPCGPEKVVLAAYLREGPAGFRDLIGEFVFALWDPRERRLALVVDAPGRKPLYYHATGDRVLWSSRAAALASELGLSAEPSDDYVADFLMNRPSLETPYRGIRRVPPSSAVVVSQERATTFAYWSPDPKREIRYRRDEEYEEHFLSVFRTAVASRIPADRPVFCELSGGLDSSTIACAADEIVGSRPGHPGLTFISYRFSLSRTSDESAFIDAITSQFDRPAVTLDEAEHPILSPLPEGLECDEPTSQLLFLARQEAVAETMSRSGASTLLSGVGGDQLFWSEPPPAAPLADLLGHGTPAQFHRACCEWARALGWSYPRTLWQGALWPFLPRFLRARWQRRNPLGEWLAPAFVRRANLRDRALGYHNDVGFTRHSRAAQYAMIRQTMRPYALEEVTTRGITDVQYPYLDRRMIEFSLALPVEQKVRPEETRSIVRRAFRGVLPEVIRTRKSKSGPNEAILRALTREQSRLDRLCESARVVELGYVDRSAFRTALQRARHGMVRNTVQLMKTLALEFWLRSSDGRRGRATSIGRQISLEGVDHGKASTVRFA